MLDTDRSPASPAAIAVVEAGLGVSLPSGYRDFLLAHDGGKPTANLVRLSGGDEKVVNVFFHATADENYYLLDGQENFDDIFPPGFIPIAEDPGGNMILIATGAPTAGGIYFWYHDREAAHPTAGSPQITKIADDFPAFAAMLYTDRG